MSEARAGVKAGNYVLDDLEEFLRKEQAIRDARNNVN